MDSGQIFMSFSKLPSLMILKDFVGPCDLKIIKEPKKISINSKANCKIFIPVFMLIKLPVVFNPMI